MAYRSVLARRCLTSRKCWAPQAVASRLWESVSNGHERILDVFPLAVELSIWLDHHVFRALYQAVALISDGTFLTFDRKYFRKAASIGGVVIPG